MRHGDSLSFRLRRADGEIVLEQRDVKFDDALEAGTHAQALALEEADRSGLLVTLQVRDPDGIIFPSGEWVDQVTVSPAAPSC